MPPKGSGAADGAGRRSAPSASTAAGGPSTSAAAQQQQPAPQPDSFAIEKLQRALAVPPDQRQHSMQAFIDSCECTAEATELLGAAPLAQLSGPTKLRSLLLLLKAHWTFGGESPAVPGISLLPAAMGPGTEMARSNMVALLCQNPYPMHPELQPLYSVAVTAGHAILVSGLALLRSHAASLANSSTPAVANSIEGRRSAEKEQGEPPVSLQGAAEMLEDPLEIVRAERPLLQQQLAGFGGGLFTARQLEQGILMWLGVLHTWAATPDGAYCGGRIDQRHAAAGRAALNAALELSDSDARSSGVLAMLSNLLRRTGAVAEAEAALRRAVAAARAAGDAFLEMNAAAALASVIPTRDGWSYREVDSLVTAVHRCLRDCKPWLPAPSWSTYREKARQTELVLADERRMWPNSYARQPLPACEVAPHPNTFVFNKVARKVGACSGCGGQSVELKFCARCQTAKYCSRSCQVAHWKAGHKAECVPLAARTGGGGGASGSRGN